MRQTYRVSRLGANTRIFGLLGPHVEVERLAEYNSWFAADQVDGVAVPMVAASDAAEILTAFREVPVSGWHIHGPALQRDVARMLDEVPATGRANAVVRLPDGGLVGRWVESPREQYALWRSAAWD
jgi:hypothetical protein